MKTNTPLSYSAPFNYGNLTFCFVIEPDSQPRHHYTVLQKAMEKREAIVHETGNVGELLIENLSEIDLFVQAGEIVKGGRQDRVMGVDLIVEKKAGPVPIPTFCVERGRWSKRGSESEHHFIHPRIISLPRR